jgi:ATPase family associated with various cellular activities (AAA)
VSEQDRWEESNARQLTAALAGLRDRLERHIQGQSSSPTSQATNHSASEEPVKAEELPSALTILRERLGLSSFEQDILLLCTAMELDTRIAGLCARAHDDATKPYPTFGMALVLFDNPSWDALSPEGALRYWRLVEVNQTGAQPLTSSALRADERIVNYLKGLNHLDERITSFLTPLEVGLGSGELAASQTAIVDSILRHWSQATRAESLATVQLLGSDPISKQLVAQQTMAKLNRRLYRLPVELLPASALDLETLARLWQRESRLLPLALYLDAEEADTTALSTSGTVSRFLNRVEGFCFLSVREAVPRLGRPQFSIDVTRPTTLEQQAAWAQELGVEAGDSPARLSAQFNLNLPAVRSAAQLARIETNDAPALLAERAWEICRQNERPRLDALAQRLEPKMTWDDLVLPPNETKLLHEITAQVGQRNKVYSDWGFDRKMNRGFGISALFAGDSGCGKTMAAEVIANELRLNLYRIDLSAVVNKYIGETEKNLRRLFDAAEEGGSILFFDEADALFGKRSEVKDSHDRYANIEINYLLQRLESYRGLAILATNMKSALDTAFVRRLRFIVNFPFPGIADRRRLWEKAFLQRDSDRQTPRPPLAELDYDRLARLNLTGGLIHSVALNACFKAASSREQIVTMPLVLEAARAEFMKLDRPISEADFRSTDPIATSRTMANGHSEVALR